MVDSHASKPVNDSDFTLAVLRNAFELWFEPEIQRRQERGEFPKPFKLWAAQILMEPDSPPVIAFNEQIQGVLQAKPDANTPLPIEKGQQLRLRDLGDIVGMQLTTEHPNAGHLTALFHKGAWYLLFDFRYNSARINLSLDVARQFYAAAEGAIDRKHLNVAVENLFAVVEIAAKSYLMIHPYPQLLRKHRHGLISTEFNRYGGKHGNVDAKYVSLFNALTSIRLKARYPDAPLSIAPSVVHEWFQIAGAMLDDVASRPAVRYEPEFVERPIGQGRK